MKLKNISPLGALDVPLLRTVVEAEEVITVTDDQARVLLLQPDNFEPADRPAKSIAADLRAEQDADGPEAPDGEEQDAGAEAGAGDTEGASK
ncbi:hypothetical protein [Arthrobacter sp. 18067]|uniref:hypothetical protein n=1 Tax=Arthrobacter sp. 18067 TaxID=2681413 RepID=UPI00135A62C8|nr:hypothetical protein [Arthrobacter sp. 18067]